jgi:hypothetical protein
MHPYMNHFLETSATSGSRSDYQNAYCAVSRCLIFEFSSSGAWGERAFTSEAELSARGLLYLPRRSYDQLGKPPARALPKA